MAAITPVLFSLFLILAGFSYQEGATALGINYGQVANNLPSPNQVVSLLNFLKISKAKIYDTNPQVLTAFSNTGIDLIVTLENELLWTMADPEQAIQWVSTHIKPYVPSTKISGILIGNEIFTNGDPTLMANLVPAMVGIRNALARLDLASSIWVSTDHSLAVLGSSYPPSSGFFRQDLVGLMTPLLEFLAATNAPFWINAYPYFAYKDDPSRISLEYALFEPNPGMYDPYTKIFYDNMLYAQVDAAIFALSKLGFGGLEVRVSETGWPSKGDQNEAGATLQNAQTYNRNLLQRQLHNEGTPLKPKQRLEIYLFALFNENLKPGPTSERNYGIYQPDGTMAYNVGLTSLETSSAASASSDALASNATKVRCEIGSLGFWIAALLLCLQVMMRRQF
ncbi:hypothetical protein AMTRI_Chr01g134770 [Amborella trichopoda]|uniref:glucan endo-1,3-beta-glucosidase 11 n=1 Tax=Amborella trichopoda TaxID=13333 RepID=UPI0009BDF599|nr:glucan endo-1,3-beta-glucosidase 11 [Amborella trichopoda]|eukprot:XP_020523194.1 glucan endo-1,3-beta-glucosidase 11 [Amborella trichopoda]